MIFRLQDRTGDAEEKINLLANQPSECKYLFLDDIQMWFLFSIPVSTVFCKLEGNCERYYVTIWTCKECGKKVKRVSNRRIFNVSIFWSQGQGISWQRLSRKNGAFPWQTTSFCLFSWILRGTFFKPISIELKSVSLNCWLPFNKCPPLGRFLWRGNWLVKAQQDVIQFDSRSRVFGGRKCESFTWGPRQRWRTISRRRQMQCRGNIGKVIHMWSNKYYWITEIKFTSCAAVGT